MTSPEMTAALWPARATLNDGETEMPDAMTLDDAASRAAAAIRCRRLREWASASAALHKLGDDICAFVLMDLPADIVAMFDCADAVETLIKQLAAASAALDARVEADSV